MPLSEGSGTTTSDRSGNGNTGTLSGATWTTAGLAGVGLSFDGINDRVNVNDSASLDLTGGMTLEAWVYPTVLSGWRTVFLKERSGGLVYALYAHDNVSQPAAYVRVGNADWRVAGASPLPLHTWTHLATTYDGATLRLYVNGQEVGNRAVGGAIQVSTGRLRMGGNAVWAEWFAGQIDEVRIYNRALTPAQIQADMAMPMPLVHVQETSLGMQCLPCYPPLQRRLQRKWCEGAGAALRTSLRACHGVHARDRHLSVTTSEALVKTTRVTPQRIPRLGVPGRSATRS